MPCPRSVRHVSAFRSGISRGSLSVIYDRSTLSQHSAIVLFITDKTLPLTHHIIVPELRRLFLQFGVSNISSCESLVQLLGPGCPNLKMIQITPFSTLVALDEIMNRHIRRWIYLQEVDCSTGISFDIDTLFHLSRLPGLTVVSFMLSRELIDRIASSNHLLVFSAL